MSYLYTRIADLQPGPRPQNFYGKVIFHGKHGDTHVLLLKDETDMFYVWVQPKIQQELKLNLRQIVRVHRCVITGVTGDLTGRANIGKAGCHIVSWAPYGKHGNPKVISSKEWSTSPEDEERIRTLSEMDKNCLKTTVNEMAEKLIDYRETRRAEKTVAAWARKVVKIDAERTRMHVNELFCRKPGSRVETKYNYPVDRKFFEDENADEFVQFFTRCPNCFEEHNKVVYVTEQFGKYKCCTCKKNLKKMEIAVRIRIDCEGFNLIFLVPTRLIRGHEQLPDLSTRFGKEYESKRDGHMKLIKFCRMAQRKLWDASLTAIHGHIIGRAESLRFVEIFVHELNFLDLAEEE